MDYTLFSKSLVPQLTRLFANASSDQKLCYLVSLNQGRTEADLEKCLTLLSATGAGYYFDETLAAPTGVCKVIAKGTNCVRTIDQNQITFSDSLLTAVAEGVPTHLILGTALPFCFAVGTDVTMLYPDLVFKYNANGYKTQVLVPSFSISLSGTFADVAGA